MENDTKKTNPRRAHCSNPSRSQRRGYSAAVCPRARQGSVGKGHAPHVSNALSVGAGGRLAGVKSDPVVGRCTQDASLSHIRIAPCSARLGRAVHPLPSLYSLRRGLKYSTRSRRQRHSPGENGRLHPPFPLLRRRQRVPATQPNVFWSWARVRLSFSRQVTTNTSCLVGEAGPAPKAEALQNPDWMRWCRRTQWPRWRRTDPHAQRCPGGCSGWTEKENESAFSSQPILHSLHCTSLARWRSSERVTRGEYEPESFL